MQKWTDTKVVQEHDRAGQEYECVSNELEWAESMREQNASNQPEMSMHCSLKKGFEECQRLNNLGSYYSLN